MKSAVKTQAVENATNEVSLNKISRSTTVDVPTDKSLRLRRAIGKETSIESENVGPGVYKLKLSSSASLASASEELPLSIGKAEAYGAVRRLEEEFVLCEIYTSSGSVEVRLQRPLFSEEPFYGMPITLTMTKQDGYRIPRVTRRNVVPSSNQEITDLINRLDN